MNLVIVGGGISGLAAAYEAHLAGLEFTLLEGSGRLGGVIRTRRQDGFVMEGGPDSILTEKPAGLELCKELGLEGELVETQDRYRRTLVARDGGLLETPDGFRLMAPSSMFSFALSPVVSPSGKFRMLLDLVLPRRETGGDESLTSFVVRRLGREALERLAQPMIAGIYSADPDVLSLQATMPVFMRLEERYGSVIRGLRAAAPARSSGPRYSLFTALKGGLERLVEALAEKLPPGSVYTGRKVRALRPDGDRWTVENEGEPLSADGVVLALPAPAAAKLIDFDPDLSEALGRIRYGSSATVNLVYELDQVGLRKPAFGFVVPAIEKLDLLACTFSHYKYPGRAPAGKALLRGYVGGAFNQSILDEEDDAIVARVRNDLRLLLGMTAAPSMVWIDRHMGALPEYRVGHLDWVARVRSLASAHPGLGLAGSAFDGVGIPDCIRLGRETVRSLAQGAMAGR